MGRTSFALIESFLIDPLGWLMISILADLEELSYGSVPSVFVIPIQSESTINQPCVFEFDEE